MSRPLDRRRAALYLRLSKDDERQGESASIASQRALLRAYADERGVTICREYVDDGYSGTDFDRPGFGRLLGDIEAGEIDLILVKDLSRLGRDYIETGRYTELYFPAKGVRCIAVNDGYDSEGPGTDLAPFRNVVNELYARDASRKIQTALHARMKSGLYIGSFAPYGYRKDPDDKNRLLVDEEAAAVVRELFARAGEGERPAALAKRLNDRGVPPPLVRRLLRDGLAAPPRHGMLWTAGGVSKLLRNPLYTGLLAQGKSKKDSFKARQARRLPADEWVVAPQALPALVTGDGFALVQNQLQSRACPGCGSFSNLFSGLAYCADCGRRMSVVGTRRHGSPANLVCSGYKQQGKDCCTNHFIDYNALAEVILEALRRETALAPDDLPGLCDQLNRAFQGGEATAAQMEQSSEQLDALVARLYEDRLAGRLGEERFCRLLARCEAARPGSAPVAPPPEEGTAPALLARYAPPGVLEPALLAALIERVEVGQGRYEQTAQGRVKRQQVTVWLRCAATQGDFTLAR